MSKRKVILKKFSKLELGKIKKFSFSLLFSFIIFLVCFIVIIFRVFFPYHKIIAITIYMLSWGIFFVPFLKKIVRGDYALRKITKKRKKTIIASGIVLFLTLLYMLIVLFPVDEVRLTELDADNFNQKLECDSLYLKKVMSTSDIAIEDFKNKSWSTYTVENMTPERIKELKSGFSRIVDHIIIYDTFINEHKYFYQINVMENKELNYRSFIIAYSAYIARFKLVYDLVEDIDANPIIEELLDEELEDFSENNVYLNLRSQLMNPENTVKSNVGRAYLEYVKEESDYGDQFLYLIAESEKNYDSVIGNYDYKLEVNIDSGMDYFEKNLMTNWLPFQKDIAMFLGDTKLSSRHEYLIKEHQIEKLYSLMEPGDIHFQRRDWYMSNSGIPGFWTHSALYVGDLGRLNEYFSEESQEMYGMELEDYIELNYPKVYQKMNEKYLGKYNVSTMEAKDVGVTMLSLEESAYADYFAVIRPRLSKEEKLKALIFAFENYGKPYDFNFDFSSDDSYVCSELVYKSYLGDENNNGLEYELYLSSGRWMISPNVMVEEFASRYGKDDQQSDFVLFIDGDEEKGTAEFKDVEEFLRTPNRGKYKLIS